MSKKKWISLLICGVMLIGALLTGCGGGSDVETGELPQRNLVLYTPANNKPQDVGLVEEAANEYLKDKINATVTLEWTDFATFFEKFPLMLQSGEQLDIVWVNGGTYTPNIAKGAYHELDDLLAKYGKDIVAQEPEILMEGAKVNGKTYGVPVNKEYGTNYAYYYKKDLVDKYNIDFSKAQTYEGYEENVLKVIKENEPGIIPFYRAKGSVGYQMKVTDDQSVEDLLRYEGINGLTGVVIDNQTDKVMTIFEADAYLAEYKAYEAWNKAGYFNTDAATTSTTDQDAIKAGKGWMLATSGKPGVGEDLKAMLKMDFVKGGEAPVTIDGNATWGSMNCIPRASVDAERAMMLLNIMHSDEYIINLFVNGIEGLHYEKVGVAENGKTIVKLPDGIATRNDSPYYPGLEWIIGNIYNTYLWDTDNPLKFENLKAQGESAIKPKSFGFVYTTDNVKTQIAACNSVIGEYTHPLSVGTLDVDKTIPEILSKLNANGMQDIIDDAQAQYDAWLAQQ